MVKLNEATQGIVEGLFSPELRPEASRLLEEECADLFPGNNTPHTLEQTRFAVLRLSKGDISKLRDAIELARQDPRDAISAAGFGYSVMAYKQWEQELKSASPKSHKDGTYAR